MDPKTLVSPEWPCVAAESGWRGDVTGIPSALEAHAVFSLDGGAPIEVRFSRASASASHWDWERGADQDVAKDVLDAAATRIGAHVAKTGGHAPFGEADELPTRRDRR